MNVSVKCSTNFHDMTQFEFEAAIYDAIRFGDISRLAERRGKSVSLYSSQLNPHDERESNLYKAALDIIALIDINPDRGAEVWRLFNDFISDASEGEADRAELAIAKAERELIEAKEALERIKGRNDRRQADERVNVERRHPFATMAEEILGSDIAQDARSRRVVKKSLAPQSRERNAI